MPHPNSPSALVLIFNGVEEMEAVAPIDILRRAELQVTVASLSGQDCITGRNGIKIVPDTHLGAVDPTVFDLFVLPGGPGVFDLVDNPSLREILSTRASSNLLTAAICAAPKVLAAAGLLKDRHATSHLSVAADIPNRIDDPVVVDGPFVTSQGAGTATQFALRLAALLASQEKADEISKSIHA